MKIIDAGRELRPEDLSGAKMVFVVGYGTFRTVDGGEFDGWFWHPGTESQNDLHGPFKSEKAAQKNALQNCEMMN
jgi:hypothetical protein